MPTRRLLGPGLMALAMLALLIGLGVWQLQRRVWKLALLAQIDQAETSPAIPLPRDPTPFAKVRVEGRLRPDLQALYGSEVRDLPSGPVIGAQLIEPMERPGLDPVLVVLGWVPTGLEVAPDAAAIEGYVRMPDHPGLFSARDDPATRRFFTLDPASIAAALGIAHAAPFTLVAMGAVADGVFPQPAEALPRPPNDHLNYAFTWFGLALSLTVVFAVYARKVPPLMNAAADTAYARLTGRFARIATLGEASSMLGWDAAAMMPPGGGAARGEQLAVLAGLEHQLLTAPAVADDLAEAEAPAEPWREANLRLMRHAYTRATAVPTDLVEATARANSSCEKTWREARRTSDFAMVAAPLAEVVRLVREAAAAMAPALGLSPYDALMDGYQPGIGASDVAPVFAQYQTFLADALPRAEALQAAAGSPLKLPGPFPADLQEALCRRLSQRAGLEFTHARLDRSTHPFCGGTPTDIRITTRYDEADCAQAIMGVLHETGHALYERGLPEAYARQPVGQAAGMGAHESQSLILEMQSCRSDAYLTWLGPQLLATFGGDPAPYAPANLARLWRRVQRGTIRVDADEMTYPAHVILRFRLEQALVSGDLAVADLPGAWNDGMADLLGITPANDAQGCLQDIHWYDGAFGYFPSYTLGAMAAAQLMAAARGAEPGVDAALAEGDHGPLLGWLRRHVHAQGSRLGFNDLLRQATGKPLDPADFEAHLTARYLDN